VVRLVAALLAVVVPASAAYSFYRVGVERRDLAERRADRAASNLLDRGLAPRVERICRRDPGRLGEKFGARRKGIRRDLELLAFDGAGEPARAGAPRLPDGLLEELRANPGEPAHARVWGQGRFDGWTVIAPPGAPEGCAVLGFGWKRKPRPAGAPAPYTGRVVAQTGVLAGLLLAVGLLVGLPLVGRIRRLTRAVGEAPERGWRIDEQLSARDELGELARAFDATGAKVASTIDALERRDATLKAYISNTTHDLAIPLTVLQHRLRAIQRAQRGGEAASGEDVDAALEESHYIASLIANMSAAAKLDAGEAHVARHEVLLDELVARVAGRQAPIAELKGVELNWAAPPEPVALQGDSVLLEQALSNLAQNAVQYNDAGGHVSLLLEATSTRFEITVADDGPGVPAEAIEAILERGARGDDARNRNPGGSGFGLAITRRVCELHGFELSIESEEGEGFVVRIHGALGHA
jgi:signal transduction histidine kinase